MKENLDVISSDRPYVECHVYFTTVLFKTCLNQWNIFVFLSENYLYLSVVSLHGWYAETAQKKMLKFNAKKTKFIFLIASYSYKGLNSNFVNQTYHSINYGQLEIISTVPVKK